MIYVVKVPGCSVKVPVTVNSRAFFVACLAWLEAVSGTILPSAVVK